LVYCTKCGFKNEDDAKACAKCGAPLQISRSERRTRSNDECFGSHGRHLEDECFGLPHGGTIVTMIFGIIIIIVGIAIFLGESIWEWLWPFVIITIGLLIVGGALYRGQRRY
jgi:uncharacterized membrane protein YvbJ